MMIAAVIIGNKAVTKRGKREHHKQVHFTDAAQNNENDLCRLYNSVVVEGFRRCDGLGPGGEEKRAAEAKIYIGISFPLLESVLW